MAGIILLLIFSFFLILLLVMPIHLRISHEKNGFFADKPSFLKLNIDLIATTLATVILDVFFIRLTWYPFQKNVKNAGKEKMPAAEKGFDLPDWNRLKFLLNTAWHIFKKSKVNKLYLYLDTGNVIINANLFPVFEILNERPRISLNINYSGNIDFSLDIQNNIWNVVRIFLYNLIRRIFIFTKNTLNGIQS
jgi:hypothetical protein